MQATYTPYQILIIASMIEREAKTEEDRPLIARVIYNRLAMNPPWRLNIDATVIYNVPREQLEVDGAITELRTVDTPWNTYTRDGLPQTPIANPGRASIEAALHPAPNPSPGNASVPGTCRRTSAGGCSTSSRTSRATTPSRSPRSSSNADVQAAADAGYSAV